MAKLKFQKMWEAANTYVLDIEPGSALPILEAVPKVISFADTEWLYYFENGIGAAYYSEVGISQAKTAGLRDFLRKDFQKSYFKGNGRVKKISDVKLTDEEKAIIDLLRETEVIRDQRKKIATAGNFMMLRFLEEVCSRKKIDMKLARRIFWPEFGDLLYGTNDISKRLENRTVVSFIYDGEKEYVLEYNAIKPLEEIESGTNECKGTSASRGKIKGGVRIVWGSGDFHKFKKGEVLITEMTRPEFLPVMKQASSIVTDEGGLTCHAAIVARELGIPCIVGTKIATRIFKDGDMVEVDADKGVVRKIS